MEDVLSFFADRPVVRFASGETLVAEGEEGGRLFALVSGEVDVVRQGTHISHIDEPGSIFGEISALLDLPASATVTALSDVSAHVVEDGRGFLGERPALALHLATLLARRLYYTTSYLVDVEQQQAGKRRDLDLVDRILGRLHDPTPGEA